ncbi:DNA-directed RNA polymerase subunit omega [Gottschalkia acidurici 9a]|uniref:DNA-directed RNA polymerase subunit omega n=1 Tax=Gottschalkia acidurici (strain ATCC 7906 / DSM 604 / BCRC 14475 / CIP 104303 / KCTC 5404 / NCIMB 10678 / 9a) TaxID=1128398 RepID=K0B165_GOTA9|nr:DNA-directed RNA polymerase subunit omega [Gottschalkia acidurici]AFS78695.1 DNA-directed RNA polymerase subunit omega [Gottschalkia acidurici 9a]
MLYPSTDDLLKKVDSRYTLVVMVSKRSRQLVDGVDPLVNTKSIKPVTIAVEEIAAGEVTYFRPEEAMDEAIEEAKEV